MLFSFGVIEVCSFKTVSLGPCVHARKPAADVPAVFFIVRAEHLSQGRFLVEMHNQDYSHDGDGRNRECRPVCVPKCHPETRPASEESHVHGVAYISVETHHHQLLRGSNRRGRSVSRPSEIPDAP